VVFRESIFLGNYEGFPPDKNVGKLALRFPCKIIKDCAAIALGDESSYIFFVMTFVQQERNTFLTGLAFFIQVNVLVYPAIRR
jgi:hypothetical protein